MPPSALYSATLIMTALLVDNETSWNQVLVLMMIMIVMMIMMMRIIIMMLLLHKFTKDKQMRV